MATYYVSNNEIKFAEVNRLLFDSLRSFELRDLPAGQIFSEETAESEQILEKRIKEDVLSAFNTLNASSFLERRWVKTDKGKEI